jgi:hypothetical protein
MGMGLITFVAALMFGSCSKPNSDISRVVNPYSDKAYINPNWQKDLLSPNWYYRLTVVDTPTNTEAASIGDGHWLHPETIRWEITEKYLIGWRAHASVPGAENELGQTSSNYRGAPVVVFEIKSHFDVEREYETLTGEKSNVISENRVDRPWHQRRFMRVDWSKNLVSEIKRQDAYPWVWGTENLEKNDDTYAIFQNSPANPKRSRFEDSYFEITTRQAVKIDIMSFMGGYGEAYQSDAASPVVDIKLSFMKQPASDYEPLHYPDSVTMVDPSGKELRDEKQFSKKMVIWEKFGFYRAGFSGQQNWDQQRGSVESNKNYNITRFNVWKKTYQDSVDKDGKMLRTLIPIEKRETKPIVYYTNVFHPENLLNASRKVEAEWNKVFKELVFYAQPGRYKTIGDVPDMWILHENSCNIQNVATVLQTMLKKNRELVLSASKQDINEIKRRIVDANDVNNLASFTERQNQETQAKADLESICSALEYYTQGEKKAFTYQRPGDLRYNMLNLITKRVPTRWSGLGPMLADSLTGEIIQATANVNLWYIDKRAADASDQIDLMFGNVKMDDLVFGADVQRSMAMKLAQIRQESSKLPSAASLKKMENHFQSLSRSNALLPTISPLSIKKRMALMAETPMEQKLFRLQGEDRNDEMRLLKKRIVISEKDKYSLSDEVLAQLSPARGNDLAQQVLQKKENLRFLAQGFADPPEFLDNLIVGIALQFKNLSRSERFSRIREAVFIAVMLHEVGHNMGLTHNMAASSDALNYGNQFWEIESLPRELGSALVATQKPELQKAISDCMLDAKFMKETAASSGHDYTYTTQDCLRQAEVMYSSIMDYHASWNADLGGLGAYDRAAIKFGYAQLVEVFPQDNLKVDAKTQNLSRWLFLNDWKKIPKEFLKNVADIAVRDHVKYSWGQTRTQFQAPVNEVPYRFCIDSSGAYGPTCKAFDFGPDMRAQAEHNKTKYWQHYFMTHFSRDRVWNYGWDFTKVVQKDLAIMDDFNNIMRWYYFYRATDKDFVGSDAEKDYLANVIMGLNHYSHVFSHPAPGDHVSTPVFQTESLLQTTANSNRLDASALLIPYNKVNECLRLNVVDNVNGSPVSAKPGFIFSTVPLGEGRPFYLGLNNDYENWHITYVGSFFSKLHAGFFLAYPGAWFPRTDSMNDPRFYNISWYRLFPQEVGKLFHDLMTENWTELGPVVDNKGNLYPRDMLDASTLEAPHYEGMGRVLPSMSSFMPYRAMFYAASLLSGYMGSELDMLKMMRVSLKGSEDDLTIFDKMRKSDIATFIHPTVGYEYRALRVGEHPVAYKLVGKLNTLKEKYERLDACVKNPALRQTDNYCDCVQTSMAKLSGGVACCYPGNSNCSAIRLAKVGEESCSIQDLEQRRDSAKEEMENLMSFLDDMRWFVKQYSNLP